MANETGTVSNKFVRRLTSWMYAKRGRGVKLDQDYRKQIKLLEDLQFEKPAPYIKVYKILCFSTEINVLELTGSRKPLPKKVHASTKAKQKLDTNMADEYYNCCNLPVTVIL